MMSSHLAVFNCSNYTKEEEEEEGEGRGVEQNVKN